MNHEQYKEWIRLYQIDELGSDERIALENHLKTCAECTRELEEVKKLHSIVTGVQSVEVTDQLLAEARQQFRAALRAELTKQTWWDRLHDLIGGEYAPRYAIALGSVVALALGIFIGALVFGPSSQLGRSLSLSADQTQQMLRGDTRITNVRFVNPEAKGGEVEFTFDAIMPVRIKGNLQDERVSRILAQALLDEQNPGVRLRTVNALASHTNPQSLADQQVKRSLITALTTDDNVGVRREALAALSKYTMDDEIKKAVLFVLDKEKNPVLRIEAIKMFERMRVQGVPVDSDLLRVLQEKTEKDDNNYIRLRAKAFLQEVKQQ